MFHALAKHGHFDLLLHCKGDLEVDDHHTAEDCALALGSAFDQALQERTGIARYMIIINSNIMCNLTVSPIEDTDLLTRHLTRP
jgi:imidazoleglycerol phosphate dehydratase HisB